MKTTDEDASRVALVDLGEDDASATVTMDWVRQSVPDFAMPFYFAGGICVVLAVLCASVFAMSPHKRRKAVSEAAEAEAEEPTEGMGPGNAVRSRKAVALAAVGTDAAERPNRSNSLRSKGRTSSTPRPETWCRIRCGPRSSPETRGLASRPR